MSRSLRSFVVSLLLVALSGLPVLAQDIDAAGPAMAPASPLLMSVAPGLVPSDPWSLILGVQDGATLYLAACCKTRRSIDM